jgi:hypothetical protein
MDRRSRRAVVRLLDLEAMGEGGAGSVLETRSGELGE